MSDILMFDVYQEYYKRIQTSKAFSKYCSHVFDIDLSQDGFCNKAHLDMMINTMKISRSDTCLDIGCGNGKIANYIESKTKCDIAGIDYSSNAIENAKKLFPTINFLIGDINKLSVPKDQYSKVYLIDSIYFSNDYEQTIMQIYNSLIDDGEIGIFYSEMMFEKDKQRIINSEETDVGKVLVKNGLNYKAIDITNELYGISKQKRIIGNKLKKEFENEDNAFLFDRINMESIDKDMAYEDFVKFCPRFYYRISKTKKI